MKKLIPFDIEKAKAGAKIVLEDTQIEVIIVNFDSQAIAGWPIIGRFITDDGCDNYELWPASGSFEAVDWIGRGKPLPPALLIEEEEARYGNESDREIFILRRQVEDLEEQVKNQIAMIEKLEDKIREKHLHYKDVVEELGIYRAAVAKAGRKNLTL